MSTSVRHVFGSLVRLTFGTVLAFSFGICLQIFAVRELDSGDYASFVLALAVGNIANAVGAAVQPVVALRIANGRRDVFPYSLKSSVLLVVFVALAGGIALTPASGLAIGILISLQIPLYALIGFGQGRLQGDSRFGALASTLPLFAVGRVGTVVVAFYFGGDGVGIFVLGLLVGLASTVLFLVGMGAYADLSVADRGFKPALIRPFLWWSSIAWLLNSDAVIGRLGLAEEFARRYSTAFTLGRLPVFSVAPLATLLLPLAAGRGPEGTRQLANRALIVSAAVFAATMILLAAFPGHLIELFEGKPDPAIQNLVRLHAVIGSTAASATLLLNIAFARDNTWSPFPMILVSAALIPITFITGSPTSLAMAQLLILAWLWLRTTRELIRP